MTTSFLTIHFVMAVHTSMQILSRKYFFVVIYINIQIEIYIGIYILKSVSICIYTYIVIF